MCLYAASYNCGAESVLFVQMVPAAYGACHHCRYQHRRESVAKHTGEPGAHIAMHAHTCRAKP
jgi:hypothetical protein